VIVIHGDLASEKDSYQYRFAAKAHRALGNTVIAAILRPGYADESGIRSLGAHGLATGDNYTPEVISALRAAVIDAKVRYGARDVTLVGHSGGAALAADLAEFDPGLASRMLLVSCPCNVPAWRRHMAMRQLNPVWLMSVRSLSPMDGVKRLSPRLQLRMAVGQRDAVAPPELTIAFKNAARAGGVLRASAVIVPEAGHGILLATPVLDELKALQASPE
jgi:pimeloyl-ACP methyl ester carboxylesterase